MSVDKTVVEIVGYISEKHCFRRFCSHQFFEQMLKRVRTAWSDAVGYRTTLHEIVRVDDYESWAKVSVRFDGAVNKPYDTSVPYHVWRDCEIAVLTYHVDFHLHLCIFFRVFLVACDIFVVACCSHYAHIVDAFGTTIFISSP